MKYKTLKGLQDILSPDIAIWQNIENSARQIFRNYGYREIRLPIIESTDIFTRSIGETSDIVEKEMYTFLDKGGRSVTLRPEGTAAFVRAYVEHHLYNEPAPQKYYYMGPMFRYERPQAFRYRQFYQIGIEAMGVLDPMLDAEVIAMLSALLDRIGLQDLNCEITSLGCDQCRPDYRKALKKFLHSRKDRFCADCKRRYDLNPLRILDCKVPSCIELRGGSPPVIEFLCKECQHHFQRLKQCLDLLKVPYTVNPNLVRGLDYYTKTAFEVTSASLGSQKAVAAGGRYDNMVDEFGGPPTPGIGFAIGIERILPLIKEAAVAEEGPDLYICPMGEEATEKGLLLIEQLRAKGLWAEINFDSGSLKSQLRKANRIRAKRVIVLGEDELVSKKAIIKDMMNKDDIDVILDVDELLRVIQA